MNLTTSLFSNPYIVILTVGAVLFFIVSVLSSLAKDGIKGIFVNLPKLFIGLFKVLIYIFVFIYRIFAITLSALVLFYAYFFTKR